MTPIPGHTDPLERLRACSQSGLQQASIDIDLAASPVARRGTYSPLASPSQGHTAQT